MKKFFALFSAALLSACVSAPTSLPPATVYDFGLPVERDAGSESWSMLSLEVKSPAWMDSTRIHYRLAYDNPFERREYSGSRWAGAPAALLAQRLRQRLGLMDGNAGCRLNFELEEFAQVFDSPRQSRGVLLVGLSLIDARRQQIGARHFLIEKAATSSDARGGIAALVAASDDLSREVSVWLENEKSGNGFADCR